MPDNAQDYLMVLRNLAATLWFDSLLKGGEYSVQICVEQTQKEFLVTNNKTQLFIKLSTKSILRFTEQQIYLLEENLT